MDLFELGRQYFAQFTREFADYGLEIDPGLELQRATGLLCYYDLKASRIYLSAPATTTPTEEFQAMMLATLLGCKDVDELVFFYSQFMPWLIAHELGHYFRHKFRLFGNDLWHEEQVANQLAVAATKARTPPGDRAVIELFVRRAMDKLSRQLGYREQDTVDTFGDVAAALQAEGLLSSADALNLELVQSWFSSPSSSEILRESGILDAGVQQRLSDRPGLIASINEEYVANALRYMYYQVGWTNIALQSRGTHYVNEFCRKHLAMIPPLLQLEATEDVSTKHIRACFKAHAEASSSAVVSRYFYKRYRCLLLRYLQNHVGPSTEGANATRENFDVLTIWDENTSDTLNYLIAFAPGSLHGLFPSQIEHESLSDIQLPEELPTPEDTSIWASLRSEPDAPTRNTLDLLAQLDRLELFRTLSVEDSLALAGRLLWATYDRGETLVWQGDFNEDVFILIEGELEVMSKRHGEDVLMATLHPGQVVGEIAWLTKGPRTATVRALTRVKCLVIKGSDLLVMVYDNPTILLQIAGTVARRLGDVYKKRFDSSANATAAPLQPGATESDASR